MMWFCWLGDHGMVSLWIHVMERSPFGSTSWNGLPLDLRHGMVSLWIHVMEWSPFGSTSWNGLPLDLRHGMVSLWIHVMEWSPFGSIRCCLSQAFCIYFPQS